MPDPQDKAKDLQSQMARLRGRIAIESGQLSERTQQVMSWRHQVASHPVATAAMALAVGYWLVPPSRTGGSSQELESIRGILDQKLAAVGSGDDGKSDLSSASPLAAMGRSAVAALGSLLLRQLAGSVIQKASMALQNNRQQDLATEASAAERTVQGEYDV